MTLSPRTRFFNLFRNIFIFLRLDLLLPFFTNGKGYDNFFVKCLPQNYQYEKNTFRIAKRDGIRYMLDISEYMEWVIYFGLAVEDRQGLYPLVKEGMVIMDIGANVGETVLNFAKHTGASGRVYGFEPVAENYNKCLQNISLNGFENTEVHQVALSDKNEMLYFAMAGNKNSGGIYMNKEKNIQDSSVTAVTLDEFAAEKNLTRLDLVKIDVEGFEFNVLKGASGIIPLFKPVLFIEIDEHNLQRQGSSPKMITDLLHSFGYRYKKADGKPFTKDEIHYDIICEPET